MFRLVPSGSLFRLLQSKLLRMLMRHGRLVTLFYSACPAAGSLGSYLEAGQAISKERADYRRRGRRCANYRLGVLGV